MPNTVILAYQSKINSIILIYCYPLAPVSSSEHFSAKLSLADFHKAVEFILLSYNRPPHKNFWLTLTESLPDFFAHRSYVFVLFLSDFSYWSCAAD